MVAAADHSDRRPTALKPAPWKVGPAVPERTEAERTAVRARLGEETAARREAARRRREEAFIAAFLIRKVSIYSPLTLAKMERGQREALTAVDTALPLTSALDA